MCDDEGLDIGEDTGTPVTTTYDVPFKFSRKIEKVTIELKPSAASAQIERQTTKRDLALNARD